MKWIQSNQPSDLVQNYFLIDNNLLREKLRYQPLQHSARIYCAEKQQVFFIKKGIKKSPGFSIENEYGLIEGAIRVEPGEAGQLMGIISIGQNQQQFFIQHHETAALQMQTYSAGVAEDKIDCSLPPDPKLLYGQQHVLTSISHLHAALIWSLHWWLFTASPVRNIETGVISLVSKTKILVH